MPVSPHTEYKSSAYPRLQRISSSSLFPLLCLAISFDYTQRLFNPFCLPSTIKTALSERSSCSSSPRSYSPRTTRR